MNTNRMCHPLLSQLDEVSDANPPYPFNPQANYSPEDTLKILQSGSHLEEHRSALLEHLGYTLSDFTLHPNIRGTLAYSTVMFMRQSDHLPLFKAARDKAYLTQWAADQLIRALRRDELCIPELGWRLTKLLRVLMNTDRRALKFTLGGVDFTRGQVRHMTNTPCISKTWLDHKAKGEYIAVSCPETAIHTQHQTRVPKQVPAPAQPRTQTAPKVYPSAIPFYDNFKEQCKTDQAQWTPVEQTIKALIAQHELEDDAYEAAMQGLTLVSQRRWKQECIDLKPPKENPSAALNVVWQKISDILERGEHKGGTDADFQRALGKRMKLEKRLIDSLKSLRPEATARELSTRLLLQALPSIQNKSKRSRFWMKRKPLPYIVYVT